jgi:hypothetical protein
MSTIQSKTFSRRAVLLATLVFAGMAVAQSGAGDGSYTVGYYTGANQLLPDAQMHIVNPGSTGGYGNPNEAQTVTTVVNGVAITVPVVPQLGDLCANIYVFLPDQEMIACCSCKVSPNGMQGFSLATDLIGNPLTNGTIPKAGAIKVVASQGGGSVGAGLPPPPGVAAQSGFGCDAGTTYTAGGVLETWITHVRGLSTSVGVTEVANETAFLSTTEQNKLQQQCFAIEASASSGGVGSKAGICLCDPNKAF